MNLGLKQIISNIVKDPSKIVTILDAWVASANPTEEQKNLAEARWNICMGCEHFREKRDVTGDPYCFKCGCNLRKKIFTIKYNECPEKKWEPVDELLWKDTQKQKKSIL